MLNLLLGAGVGTDPIFGLTPGEFFFGLIVIVIVLAVLFWVARQLHIL